MFSSHGATPKKISEADKKSRTTASPARHNTGLALDTTFSKSATPAPQQVFPTDPRLQIAQPSDAANKHVRFDSGHDIHSLSVQEGRQERIPSEYFFDRIRNMATTDSTYAQPGLAIPMPPPSRQPKPQPLNLLKALPIPTPKDSRTPDAPHQIHEHRTSDVQEPITPMIVITPAEEDFSHDTSLLDLPKHRIRVTSSMYSRRTDGLRQSANPDATPPMPPFTPEMQHGQTRFLADRALQIQTASKFGKIYHAHSDSTSTVFEEDPSPFSALERSAVIEQSIPSPATIASPRRSVGWWNYVKSPFSATSNASFWKTPRIDDYDSTPMLKSAQPPPETDDDSPVAPPTLSARSSVTITQERAVNRPSMMLPEVLDDRPGSFDIYRIPSTGEAAAYYDLTRHFPSLILDTPPEELRSVSRDLTPFADLSQHEEDDSMAATRGMDSSSVDGNHAATSKAIPDADGTKAQGRMPAAIAITNPFEDAASSVGAPSTETKSRAMFSSPQEDELATPEPIFTTPKPTYSTPQRDVHAADYHESSPLSPTPILERAQLAHVITPDNDNVSEEHPSHDEPVHESLPMPMLPPTNGLGTATMASRQTATSDSPMSRPFHSPPTHQRNHSYGLGISEAGDTPRSISPALPYNAKRGFEAAEDEEKGLDGPPRQPLLKRYIIWLLALAACLIIFMIVWLVTHLPQKHQDMPVNAQWVNLTGFPALPTGIATVAQPKTVRQESGCVAAASLWSCDLAPEQRSVAMNQSTLPDFMFEIRFKNDSQLNSSQLQSQQSKRGSFAAIASKIVGESDLLQRDFWSDELYTAVPAVPNVAEQMFLGNTTDNNTLPYQGEATPFYISLLEPSYQFLSQLHKRDNSVYPYPTSDSNSTITNSSSATNAPTNRTESIPKAILDLNGSFVASNLYASAEVKPLMLYKRGRQDEHYGFYTYFDRSIYVTSGTNGSIISNIPIANASAVCTWSQTRMLVQIWTRSFVPASGDILPAGTSNSSIHAINSTASDMQFPGSMPYAVTITTDRHGGDASSKGVYCHDLDSSGHVVDNGRAWIYEDRAFGGTLINPAAIPVTEGQLSNRDSGYSGVDGGNGGCACAWQNWS